MKWVNRARVMIPAMVAVSLGLAAGDLQAAKKKLTLEQAQEFSKKSGRPIFAVAGSAT